MTRKPEPKRERTWMPHREHCRCDVALEEVLTVLRQVRESYMGGYGMDCDHVRVVIEKYSKQHRGSVAGPRRAGQG